MLSPSQLRKLKDSNVKRSISIGEAMTIVLALLGAIIGVYTQAQVRLHDLELRMSEKEKTEQISESQFEKINAKLDAMRLEMFDIKVELVKKADKK